MNISFKVEDYEVITVWLEKAGLQGRGRVTEFWKYILIQEHCQKLLSRF